MKADYRSILASVFLLGAAADFVNAQITYRGKEEKLPITVAPQPIAFSHKTHVQARMACQDCHAEVSKSVRAGLPDSGQCMLCHQTIRTEHSEVQKLSRIHQQKSPGAERAIEWVRVYSVPGFVFFSHASHATAGVGCADCHGPVEQSEVLAKERSTSMIACMNCHEQKNAPNECHTCHELGQ
jgi:formate-dependent nitrite reductase cytochrome c552 subunit